MAGSGAVRASARRLALLGLTAAWIGGCPSSESPGGFADDSSESSDPSPPDLPQSECDPRYPTACGDGYKCSYVVDPEFGPLNRCVELLGEGLVGEACELLGDSDTCGAHSICWGRDADGGVCVEFCSPALLCVDPLATCVVSNQSLLSLCLPKCDPLLQDCEDGWGCYPDDFQRWACDRDQSSELGAHGDPCDCLNCCDPGLACMPGGLVDAEGCGTELAGCCARICALDDGAPVEGVCPSEAERCEPYYDSDSVLMGYDNVGICEL